MLNEIPQFSLLLRIATRAANGPLLLRGVNTYLPEFDYNNFIVGHQTDVVSISMDYISLSVHSEDENPINSKRQQVVKQLKKSINEVNRAEGYNGDNRLKGQAIDVFELYVNSYTTDFNESNSTFMQKHIPKN